MPNAEFNTDEVDKRLIKIIDDHVDIPFEDLKKGTTLEVFDKHLGKTERVINILIDKLANLRGILEYYKANIARDLYREAINAADKKFIEMNEFTDMVRNDYDCRDSTILKERLKKINEYIVEIEKVENINLPFSGILRSKLHNLDYIIRLKLS